MKEWIFRYSIFRHSQTGLEKIVNALSDTRKCKTGSHIEKTR